MRKIIIVILVLLSLTGCKKLLSDKDEYYTTWYVKNSTDYPIKIVLSFSRNGVKKVIFPNDSAEIFSFPQIVSHGKPTFDVLYDNVTWGGLKREDQRIDILSHKEQLMKTWYFTNKDDADKQFFNGNYWNLHIRKILGSDYVYGVRDDEYRWVFDVLPEDIDNQ